MLFANVEPDRIITLSSIAVGKRNLHRRPAFVLIMEICLLLGYLPEQMIKVALIYKVAQEALFTEVHQGIFHLRPPSDRVGI